MQFREITIDDFPKLVNSYQYNSYHLLHSILGYSWTEFIIEQEASPYREFVLDNSDSLIQGAIRLSHLNQLSRNIRLQPLVIARDLESIKEITKYIQKIIGDLVKYENIDRLYSFLFKHEKVELQVLRECNFEQEAELTEHFFLDGNYQNVMVLGTGRIKNR